MGFFTNKKLPTKEEIEHISISDVSKYIELLDFPSNFIFLKGPFISEDEIKNSPFYKNSILQHRHNLFITRKIVLLTDGVSYFPTRDNCCVKLGIDPHNHNFEILYNTKTNDFLVDAVDGFILENEADKNSIKSMLMHFPPTVNELGCLKTLSV